MDKFVIRGGNPLLGTVRISGAKNAALPAMAAAILTDETVTLENIPDVRDIQTERKLLVAMGAEVELGYDFHPRVWGLGLATEAARAVMTQAFGTLGIERVVAVVKPDHIPSQRVLEKAGLRPSGTCEAYGEPMLPYEAHRELWRAGA